MFAGTLGPRDQMEQLALVRSDMDRWQSGGVAVLQCRLKRRIGRYQNVCDIAIDGGPLIL